jgi:hypothetical protein
MMAKNVRTRYRDAKTVMASLRPWLDPARAAPAALPATRAAYLGVAESRRVTVAAAAVKARDAAAAVATPPPPAPPPPAAPDRIPVAAVTPAVNPQEFGQVNVSSVAGQTVAPGRQSRAVEQQWWQKRATQNKLIAAGSTLLVALVAIVAVMRTGPETKPQQTEIAKNDTPPAAQSVSEQPVSGTGSDDSASATTDGAPRPSDTVAEDVIGDDGRTLWASPTLGSPPDLRYIPAGAQTVIMLRTADLFSDGSGKGLLAAMGPAGSWLANWIKTETTFELAEIERLDIALYPSEAGEIEYSLVVYPNEQLPKEGLLARWGNPTAQRYAEGIYFQRGQTAFYIPLSQANAFACGNVKQMHGVIDTLEEAAWLAAPLEKLRLQTEAQRQVNILFLPDYLRSTRETLYPGRLSPLHEVVSWVLGPGEDVQAGLLSAHTGAQLFLELRLYCARQKQPQVMARELYGRLGQASGRLSAHLLSLSVSQYSQPVLAGMPGMLRSLHQYTRHDRDQPKGQQAVLRCYLPPGAARHLATATDLALLETGGTSAAGAAPASKPQTVWERLKQPTTLAFEKDNLINAMQLLSDDIGVPIEILGNDLKLEGITKNQSFGIDMRDQPAAAILTTIALRANPTKVSDPQDPALKLIYVVKEKHQGGADVIWITTRAAAAQRGDRVPPQFQMNAEK